MQRLADAREKLVRDGEEVLVKASGRAMDQALRVGEWFRTKETEMDCKIEVRTGNVSVVDDIVDVEDAQEEQPGEPEAAETGQQDEPTTMLEGGDTTLELLGDRTTGSAEQPASLEQNEGTAESSGQVALGKARKRKRKKRPTYDEEDLPEQRLRWVKTVAVAISFKA
jgi:ribonuclease P/MRP protein subunit POP7